MKRFCVLWFVTLILLPCWALAQSSTATEEHESNRGVQRERHRQLLRDYETALPAVFPARYDAALVETLARLGHVFLLRPTEDDGEFREAQECSALAFRAIAAHAEQRNARVFALDQLGRLFFVTGDDAEALVATRASVAPRRYVYAAMRALTTTVAPQSLCAFLAARLRAERAFLIEPQWRGNGAEEEEAFRVVRAGYGTVGSSIAVSAAESLLPEEPIEDGAHERLAYAWYRIGRFHFDHSIWEYGESSAVFASVAFDRSVQHFAQLATQTHHPNPMHGWALYFRGRAHWQRNNGEDDALRTYAQLAEFASTLPTDPEHLLDLAVRSIVISLVERSNQSQSEVSPLCRMELQTPLLASAYGQLACIGVGRLVAPADPIALLQSTGPRRLLLAANPLFSPDKPWVREVYLELAEQLRYHTGAESGIFVHALFLQIFPDDSRVLLVARRLAEMHRSTTDPDAYPTALDRIAQYLETNSTAGFLPSQPAERVSRVVRDMRLDAVVYRTERVFRWGERLEQQASCLQRGVRGAGCPSMASAAGRREAVQSLREQQQFWRRLVLTAHETAQQFLTRYPADPERAALQPRIDRLPSRTETQTAIDSSRTDRR